MTTLENRFPLLAVEHGRIISKDADITVAFEVELPELYTVTGAEYEAIHSCWCKAIKVLCRTTPSSTNRTGSSRNATNRSFRRTT
ncbi:DUF3875 domain-containing protein [Phocaeicola vulgatus]|nr:DUF3875 domain-containing protein [Phocaeicola vulgatus]